MVISPNKTKGRRAGGIKSQERESEKKKEERNVFVYVEDFELGGKSGQ